MSTFDDDFGVAAAPDLLAQFGEPIGYLPKGGPPRTVLAMVIRPPIAGRDGPRQGQATHGIVVLVRDHPHEGIDPACLDTGADKVELAVHKGGRTSRRAIAERLGQSGGMVKLAIA